MSSPTELLQESVALLTEISRKLDKPEGGEGGSAAGDAAKKRGKKTPSVWQATEGFMGSLGNFLPGFGEAGQLMRNVRGLGDSFEDLQRSLRPEKKKKKAKLPSVTKARKTILGSGGLPSVYNRTQLVGGSAPAQAGVAAGSMPGNFSELTKTLEALTSAVKELTSEMQQDEGSSTDPAERLPDTSSGKGGTVENGGGRQSAIQQVTGSQHQPVSRVNRPPQNVPSASDAEKGKGAIEAAELLELL